MEALRPADRMNYREVLQELEGVMQNARQYMMPKCRACRICNSQNCKMIPTERSGSAIRNYDKLQQIRLVYDTIYEGGDGSEIDSSVELFGHRFRAPIMSGAYGHVSSFNPSTHFSGDYDFTKALLDGVMAAGCFGWTPDTMGEGAYTEPLRCLREHGGVGIPAIKSWSPEIIREKIRMAEDAGVMAIGHDIDCVGLAYLSVNGKGKTYPKSAQQLREIFSITKKPFILKGIMSARGALKAVEAGATGIVISNHAGNTMDQSRSTIEVLEEIRNAVGDKLLLIIDGGFRHGEDVFKALALGADAVLIGRPYIVVAEGGEARGVELYTQKLVWELQNAMRMTGCRTLKDITRDKVVVTKEF